MEKCVNRAEIIKLLILLLCVSAIMVGSTEVKATSFPFEVETIIPENQVDKSKTYFDLKLKKNQKQTLEVILRNLTKKDITVGTTFNRLSTNSNGVMQYDGLDSEPDKTLTIDIEGLTKVDKPKKVIKAESEETLKIMIQAPDKDYPGILAGGLTFKLLADHEKEKSKSDNDLALMNDYGYDVAVILHGNVAPEAIQSQLVLSTIGIRTTNGRNLISANLQNPQPKALKELRIVTKVRDKSSGKIVLEDERNQMEVAPNSNFDYGIPLDGRTLKAGDYLLELAITADSGKWDLSQAFEIKKSEANEILKEAKPHAAKSKVAWYVFFGLLTVGGIIILFTVSYRKTQATSKKKNRKKQGSKHTKRH